MAATFTWTVQQMTCYPQAEGQTDVVFQVLWNCLGEENGYASISSNWQNVTYEAGTPYTPYADLTQDQVLGWVWAAGVNKAEVEASLQAALNAQINPPTVTPPLPWVPTPPSFDSPPTVGV